MKTYISNAFSLQMVPKNCHLQIIEISKDRFYDLIDKSKAYSIIGHPDTAKVLGLPFNRKSIMLEKDDHLLVAQLQGGRLPEGATELPEGFSFSYRLIIIM